MYKAEIETWVQALQAYDAEEVDKALELFNSISSRSTRILCNVGLIHATLGDHELAVETFGEAVQRDEYLGIAHFQKGVSNFLLENYSAALDDFLLAHRSMRENREINYEQLGLAFQLYAAEILFNAGLCQIRLGNLDDGLADMEDARLMKATPAHDVIDQAVVANGEGYTVFSIGVGILYRPPILKVQGLQKKNFMQTPTLIAVEDSKEAFVTFSGVERLAQGRGPDGQPLQLVRKHVGEEPEAPRAGGSPPRNLLQPPASAPPTPPRKFGNVTFAFPRSASPSPKQPTSPLPRRWFSALPRARTRSATSSPSLLPTPPPEENGKPEDIPSRSIPPRSTTRSLDQLSSIARRTSPRPPSQLLSPVSAISMPSRLPPPTPVRSIRRPGSYASLLNPQPSFRTPQHSRSFSSMRDQFKESAEYTPRKRGPPSRSSTIKRRSQVEFEDEDEGYFSTRSRKYAPSETSRRRYPRRRSTYFEDEDENSSNGDFDEGMQVIRVKVFYQDDVRGMAVIPTTPFEDFIFEIAAKFERAPEQVQLKFEDDDGHKISLRDQGDFALAVETARSSARGRPDGKLMVWCNDN